MVKGKTTMKHRTHATKWAYGGRDSDQVVNKHEPIPMQVMVARINKDKIPGCQRITISSASNCRALSKKKRVKLISYPGIMVGKY